MNNSSQPTITTVAKKFLIALSGLALVIFIILHLLGNLALYRSDGTRFNAYAAQLHSFGGLVIVGEIILLAIFAIHVFGGILAKKTNFMARPIPYRKWRPKGRGTPSNFSSRSMIISGTVILIFTLLHVWQFRFGPDVEQGYVVTQKSEQIRDLYRLVVEVLKNPWMGAFYCIAMIFIGIHLRHGIWSAFQSLGWTAPHTSLRLRIFGAALGALLAIGFLFIPIWIYFGVSL